MTSTVAHIEEITDPDVLRDLSGKPGFYVSFDEVYDLVNGDWEGPFESQEAATEYAKSIIEAAAVASVKSMFNN